MLVNDHQFLFCRDKLLLAEIQANQQSVQCIADRQELCLAHIGLNRANEFIIDLFLLLFSRIVNITRQ